MSVWLALDLILASKLTQQVVLEPASQEDLETELSETEPGRATSTASLEGYTLIVQTKLRSGDAWTVNSIRSLLKYGSETRPSASAEIEAMGRLIDAYLSRDGELPELEQAWCNAAYWFNEGMLEPLDTVAMVKLETAIENLFSAASAAGSKRRMREALKSMFGIEESETVAPSSDLTYKKLIDDIVTVRSRVLHGTWRRSRVGIPA